ncbi:hypothetical protein ACFOLM_23930 [Deinococcus soli (ex Cha et al. 2016)]
MGYSLPEDPDSPEFQELLAQLRQSSPQLAAAVQGMVRDPLISEDNEILATAEKNARRANAPMERVKALFMTTNANGEPVFNKTAALAVLGVVGGLAFAGIAMTPADSGGSSAKQEAAKSASEGTTVTNPDGSTTTTYSDGSTLTKTADGTQIVKKPNGEELTKTPDGVLTTTYPDGHKKVTAADGSSVETLADGSTITRDAAGKVVANTPPVTTGSDGILASPQGAGTQAAGTLGDPYQGTPPPASDSFASSDPYAAGSAPASPSVAETTGGMAEPGDPYAGTPYQAGIYNPTEAELAAGYKPGQAPAEAAPTPISATSEAAPVLLTPTAAEATAGFTPATSAPVTTGAPAASQGPAASTTQLTVYRVGRGVTPGEASGATSGTAGQGQPTAGTAQQGAEGGNSTQQSSATFRKTSPVAVQVMRIGAGRAGDSTPGGTAAPSGNTPATGSAAQGSTGQMMVAFRKAEVPASVTRVTRTSTAAVVPVAAGAASDVSPVEFAPLAASSDTGVPVAPQGEGTAQAQQGTSRPGAAGVPSPYRLGQRVLARLETGVYVAQGAGTLPIYASTQDGTLWRGTISLDRTKRVLITFDRAVLKDGQEVEVQAAAYNLDGTPGLKAQYRDIAPTLANDLIRSAVSGVKDYVDAKLQATTTSTSAGGAVTVQRQVPTIWESVAGSATGIFQLPATQGTFVTVAQIPVGEQFALVYGPVKTEQSGDQ